MYLRMDCLQWVDQINPPNFLPQHFPTQSIGTERKKWQKQRKWLVGMKIDRKKLKAIFCPSTPSREKANTTFLVYQSYLHNTVPCTLSPVLIMDPQKIPIRVLIPIRVMACPVPVTGYCAFWYQHISLSVNFQFSTNWYLKNQYHSFDSFHLTNYPDCHPKLITHGESWESQLLNGIPVWGSQTASY